MAVTVERILTLETFLQNTKLIAGHDGIKNVITYVTIAEAPDFYEWVAGGEFVLTTLYAFKDRPEYCAMAFTELAKRRIAAIGVKVQRFFPEIPKEIIEIADKYQVPLFEIRRETKFREIIQAVAAELNNYQTNMLLEIEQHYQELVKAALASGDFSQYLTGIGRRRQCSVLCIANGRLLGMYLPPQQAVQPQEVMALLDNCLRHERELVQYSFRDGLHIFPCIMKGQPLGYLVLCDKKELAEKHLLMANQLATFLTLKMVDQLETEQKMLTSLFDDILYKRSLTEDELRERLALHGLKHKNMYRVIILRDQENGAIALNSQIVRSYGYKIVKLLEDSLLIIKPDELVILAANQHRDDISPPRWLKSLGPKIFKEGCPVIMGIGPAVGNARDIPLSYQMAKSTVKAGLVFNQSGVLYYADYLVRIMLAHAVNTPEQKYLLAKVIEPLKAQDEKHNTNLLKTLNVLIFANSLEEAAAKLYVHVNTVRYRINKIRDLTGYDFLSAKDRYVITTAYLMYCYTLLDV